MYMYKTVFLADVAFCKNILFTLNYHQLEILSMFYFFSTIFGRLFSFKLPVYLKEELADNEDCQFSLVELKLEKGKLKNRSANLLFYIFLENEFYFSKFLINLLGYI